MIQDWNSYRHALNTRVEEFAGLNPQLMQGFMTMNGAAGKHGTLGTKVHELIALAVAVTTRCDGCIANHTRAAVAAGAGRDEIAEALGVAIALNAGAALTYTAHVLDAIAEQG